MRGERLYRNFLKHVDLNDISTILDIWATSDQKNEDSNFFLKKFADCKKVTALSNEDARWLENVYPDMEFIFGDGAICPLKSLYLLSFSPHGHQQEQTAAPAKLPSLPVCVPRSREVEAEVSDCFSVFRNKTVCFWRLFCTLLSLLLIFILLWYCLINI